MIFYHYTDQAGFLGIVGGLEIWATKIQYLNDRREYKVAESLAFKALDQIMRFQVSSEAQSLINRMKESFEIFKFNNTCIFSLSEKPDLLSQWRGYSSGMSGYSVGFNESSIQSLVDNSKGEVRFEKCIYDGHQQVILVSEIIEKYITIDRRSTIPNVTPSGILFDERVFSNEFSLLSSYLKDRSFSEEKEWRIIALRDFEFIDFRPGRSSLIPFTKLKIEKPYESFNKFIIGHTPSPELAINATEEFLIKKFGNGTHGNGSPFEVKSSSIPFRSW